MGRSVNSKQNIFKVGLQCSLSAKLKVQYKHFFFFAERTKNKAILCFKHTCIKLNSFVFEVLLVCFNFSQFPVYALIFPIQRAPAPIPKIL